jgi:RIO-like serine/threonine protein kinase
MDFSNFTNEEEVMVQDTTRILVIDFVNRNCVHSTTIENFKTKKPDQFELIQKSVEEVSQLFKTKQVYKENIKKAA